MIKILSVFGTRPEAIKMAPLILKMREYPEIKSSVCVTAQHREMLDSVMQVFRLEADYDLNIMRSRQSLNYIMSSVISQLDGVLEQENPDIVLVHGDTTTSAAAALAAVNRGIEVGHVEAGLRTYDKQSPFPEEINRTVVGHIASYHFAPTDSNAKNLIRENIMRNIIITGNTVIDSLKYTVKPDYKFKNPILASLEENNGRIIMLTAHRRENIGRNFLNIFRAVNRIVEEFPDVTVVYPVHRNPVVANAAQAAFSGNPHILLIEPVDIDDMHNLMNRVYMVMTDSGGIQEEAPSLGKPVLVLRNETERPEAIEAGTVKLSGVEEDTIYADAAMLLSDEEAYKKMAQAVNPYGDGKASERICDTLIRLHGSK